jgi:hypothetical protein
VGGNPLSFIDPTGLLGVFVGETIVRGAGAGLAKGLARTAANIGANLLVKQITPAGSTRVDKPILPSQIKPSKPQATPQPQLSASKPRSTFQLDMKALSGNMEYWQNYGGGGILHTLASPVTDIIASHYEARLHDGMYGRCYWRGVGIRAKGTSRAWTVISAASMIRTGVLNTTKVVAQTESKVFLVTKEGVVLPKGAKIPSEFIENPFRSSNYGIMENEKFVEKLRIDPATPAGMKGPNFSHYHLNGSAKHLTENWPWW